MDLFDDIQQNQVTGAGWSSTTTLFYSVADRPHRGPGGGPGRRARDLRDPGPPQRDHRDEGGRHQRVPRRAPGAGHGPRSRACCSSSRRSTCCRTPTRSPTRDFNVIKGRPPQASSCSSGAGSSRSDGRFYNFDYIVERERGATPRPRRARAAAARFSVYGLSVYDVDPARWELREQLYTARAFWNAAQDAYELDHGWRRATAGSQTSFHSFQSRARARHRARPGRRARAPGLLQARGQALRHDALRRAARRTSPRSRRAASTCRASASSSTASWRSRWWGW